MAINLNFSEEQQLIQNTAREFFRDNCPPELVRQYENSEEEFPRQLWAKMAEMGWLGMTLPADYDGLGCSFVDMYALYIELGRFLVPSPHLDSSALCGTLVAELGSEAQKRTWLPQVAVGEAILSPAIMEPDGLYGAEGITLAAKADGGGFRLSGVKTLVPYVGSASRLVVAARTGGAGEDGVSLFLVDPKAAGVTAERTPNMGGYPLYTVSFKDVVVSADDVLGTVGGAWAGLDSAMLRAAVLQSAMVVGAGERVLEITADYAKTRVQFGTPIGKHQAVQYLTTDILIETQVVRLLGIQAAWRIDSGQPCAREASLAKAAASKAIAHLTFASHEVHAGIGFMVDYDLQLYTLRGKHWEYNLGDHRHHLERAVVETL